MNGQPESVPAFTPAVTTSTITVPAAPHVTLIQRVADLEDALAKLTTLHNKLAEDARRELGL